VAVQQNFTEPVRHLRLVHRYAATKVFRDNPETSVVF